MARPPLAAGGLAAQLDRELPTRLAVGGGSCLFVSGHCTGTDLGPLALELEGGSHPLAAQGMPRAGVGEGEPFDAFWGFLPIKARADGTRATVALTAGSGRRVDLGELELVSRLPPEEAPSAPPSSSGKPLVAICMAVYDPPLGLLERQIESLKRQGHSAWICLVGDDGSSPDAVRRLAELTEDDSRFVLSPSPQRLGIYRNFERLLSIVPPEAELIALCDQDDHWHPDKLATLVAAIGDANLAFSDARIIDEADEVLSQTFWSYKRVNHTNLATLLLDNSVSGSAALFRRDLLEGALPFPPPLEGSWHDHWLASVALATGEIAYVDRPLYDYVQHPGAATRLHPAAALGPDPALAGRASRFSRAGIRLRLEEGRWDYFHHVCRIALMARVLEMRCGELASGRKLRAMRRVARLGRPPEPAAWLTARLLRATLGADHTARFERQLLKGLAWRRVASSRARRAARR